MINILGIWLVGNVLLAAVKGEGSEAASAKDLIFQFYVSSRPLVDLTPIIPAVDLALELINMDPNVLPGYNFKYLNVVNSYVSGSACAHCISQKLYDLFLLIIRSVLPLLPFVASSTKFKRTRRVFLSLDQTAPAHLNQSLV